jgi:hypothetical protein
MKRKIIEEAKKQGIIKPEAIQYILGTVEHETAGTFKPVREAFWLSEEWRKKNLSYYPYYGRGFVQITHQKNYEKFSKLLNVDLVKNPDLALELENALFILIYGMKEGLFTGKKLSDFFNKYGSNFIRARNIINGLDRAERVARMAQMELIKPS